MEGDGLGLPAGVHRRAPLGAEFRVNTFTPGHQGETAIAGAPDGRFVVVWAGDGSGTPPGQPGIFAQRFDADGVRLGPEWRVDSYTTGFHDRPAVAMDPGGAFVVVWDNGGQDGDSSGVFGQRYDSSAAPVGPEFRVNTSTLGSQFGPRVDVDASGNFVVAWTHIEAVPRQAFGRRFDAAGVPQGAEFALASAPAFGAIGADVVFESSGGFVTTWTDQLAGNLEVLGRRFGASGAPLGPQFVVNGFTAGSQSLGSMAPAPHGGFVAAWSSSNASPFETKLGMDCARLYTVPPCRLVDTRVGSGALGANTTRNFIVRGACGIPADARAVAVIITAVAPTDMGLFRLFPAGDPLPLASTVNFVAGQTRAGNAVMALGADGQLSVRCEMMPGSTGRAHLVLDVAGYFKR